VREAARVRPGADRLPTAEAVLRPRSSRLPDAAALLSGSAGTLVGPSWWDPTTGEPAGSLR